MGLFGTGKIFGKIQPRPEKEGVDFNCPETIHLVDTASKPDICVLSDILANQCQPWGGLCLGERTIRAQVDYKLSDPSQSIEAKRIELIVAIAGIVAICPSECPTARQLEKVYTK